MKLNIRPAELEQDAHDLLDDYIEAKKTKEDAERAFRLAEQALLESMQDLSDKTRSKRDGDKVYRATYVQSTSTSIDAEELQNRLGKVKFRKLCDLKLNNKKVEEAIDSGEVPLDQLAGIVQHKDSKPFIRFTEGEVSDDQSP